MPNFTSRVAIAAIVAYSAAIVAATPASATPTEVRVSVRDLDLGTDAGRDMLQRRLYDAASRVCPVERQLDLNAACRRAAIDGAATQIARADARS